MTLFSDVSTGPVPVSFLEQGLMSCKIGDPWSTALLWLQHLVPGLLPPDTETNSSYGRVPEISSPVPSPLPLPLVQDSGPEVGVEKRRECSERALVTPSSLSCFLLFLHSLIHSLTHHLFMDRTQKSWGLPLSQKKLVQTPIRAGS